MTKRLCSALLALSTAVMCLCACTAGGQVSASGAPPSGSSSAPAPSPVSQSAQEPQPEPETPAIVTDPSANPLTGLAKADDWPEGMRPLAVMLDNVQAALPQRGLQSADLVYEMVTEGASTRLMAVYSDYTSMPEVGPVRSAGTSMCSLCSPWERCTCMWAAPRMRRRFSANTIMRPNLWMVIFRPARWSWMHSAT